MSDRLGVSARAFRRSRPHPQRNALQYFNLDLLALNFRALSYVLCARLLLTFPLWSAKTYHYWAPLNP